MAAGTGHEPTDEDLAAALKLNLTEIREARSVGCSYRALSMDAPTGDAQTIAHTHGEPERGYQQVEAELTLDVAMKTLSEREREVLDMRFHQEMLQREIAEVVGVSQMQISRIISGSIERMSVQARAVERSVVAA